MERGSVASMSGARSEPSIEDVVARLRTAGCVFAEDEARILVDVATDADDLEQLVARRVAGEPLEYIVGATEFGGLMVAVRPGVFVPRQRSLLLVEIAAEVAGSDAYIADLCCGTGALAAVLAVRLPRASVVAADIDLAAVQCAQTNLAGRGEVFCGDLFDALPAALRGRLDIVVCNVPYVPTAAISTMPPEARDHEPQMTLDGGVDGLDLLRRVASAAPAWTTRPAHLVMEVGRGQVDAALAIFADAGFSPAIRDDDERGAIAIVGAL